MPLGREVDLAREERLRKADLCIEQFHKFNNSKGYQKALKRQGEEVQETANLVQNQIMNLLNSVKADKADAEWIIDQFLWLQLTLLNKINFKPHIAQSN